MSEDRKEYSTGTAAGMSIDLDNEVISMGGSAAPQQTFDVFVALDKKTEEVAILQAQLARLRLLEPILKSILLDRGGMTVDLNHLAFTTAFNIHIDGKPLREFMSASDIETQDSEIRVSVHHIDEEERG